VVVLDEVGAIAIPTATVVLRWTETDQVRRPLRQEVASDGGLVLCAPPDARRATLWAEFGDVSSEESVVGITRGALHEVELRLRTGSVTTGRLIGEVRDAMTDRPVVAAAISVVGGTAMTETNRRGVFILSGVPVGVHELAVRHLGYAPLEHTVAVLRGVTTEVEIGMAPQPVEVAPIVAVATRSRRLEIKGFYERKYWGELTGNGYFFSPEYIERWRPSNVRFLVASNVPGITWSGSNRRMSSGFSSLTCRMTFFLDGFEWSSWPNIPWSQLAGVEVYKGPASLPAEFSGSDARCGAVVVWTN